VGAQEKNKPAKEGRIFNVEGKDRKHEGAIVIWSGKTRKSPSAAVTDWLDKGRDLSRILAVAERVIRGRS